MMFTILGATGFIGSHLAAHLKKMGANVYSPGRDDDGIYSKQLGDVIYSIGYTADFRKHPLETAEAHVGVLTNVLRKAKFRSLLYLSSTRVYEGAEATEETADLSVNPNNSNHVFNLTKLAGEACCLSQANPAIRIARVSNVLGPDYGSENFVFSVLKDALEKKHVTLQTTPDSSKDYIWIDDLMKLLPIIAEKGQHRIYNVANGTNVTNRDLLKKIVQMTGCEITVASNAKKIDFLPIRTDRIVQEFGFKARDILGGLDGLYEGFQDYLRGCK